MMEIRKIQAQDFEGKKVLIRADFNVEVREGRISEKFKLEACKETVDYICSFRGARVALCSHLGRPEGKIDEKYSLKQFQSELENILEKKIVFVADCIGAEVSKALSGLSENEVLLLENVRFYPEEEKNDKEFSQKMSQNFNIFVNEAFSVSHRDQSSVTGVAKCIPSFGGLWLQRELENLDRVVSNKTHPALAIIGGAKIETKLPLINLFENQYDNVLIGGKIANEAIDQGMTFSSKVIFPIDFAQDRLDIGEQTIQLFKEKIAEAKVIVWNGPMGKFEEKPYDAGTSELLQAVCASSAFTLIGGGESVQMLEEYGLMDKISFVSTGGGAMLEYLSGNSMPGLETIRG